MGVLSLLLLLALAGLLGAAVVAAAAPGAAARRREPALALVAGLVALHAVLLVLDLAGVPWRRGTLAAGWGVALAAAGGAAWRRRTVASGGDAAASGGGLATPSRRARVSAHWGEGVALAAALLYAAAAWTRRVTVPDFVYHWGLKAKRHLLAGGIDYAFLADPLRLTDHPDYPALVSGLYATIGVVRGGFHERAALLASVAFFALAVAGARRAARAAGLPPAAVQGTVAAVALTLAGFGIGYRMAGAADWPIVAALLLALPALVRPPADLFAGRVDALRLGLAAALAAGAKIEGVPLAALLVAAGLVRWAPGAWRAAASASAGAARRAAAADLARLVVPPLALAVPWAIQNLRHGLFAAENTGPLVAARVPVAVRAAAESFATAEWLGLPWLLLLLPALLALRPTRAAAAVLLAQSGFYAWVYLTSPVDTRFLVLSSLPRLLFHLVPPLLVLLAVALFARRGTAPPLPAAAPGAGGAGEGIALGRPGQSTTAGAASTGKALVSN